MTRAPALVCLLAATAALAACVSTKEMMAAAVLDRAQHDLVCDSASIRTRMAGNINRTRIQMGAGERQGTVERATFAADGCGGSEVYTVECVRGVCFAVQDVPAKDKTKKTPAFANE